MRGNVLDLAIAVVIGAAFGKIIASLVDDIITPPIGLALGNVDCANLFVNLSGKDYPPVLSLSDSDQGDALRALHVRVEVNRLGAVRQMLKWKTRCRDPTLLTDSLFEIVVLAGAGRCVGGLYLQ